MRSLWRGAISFGLVAVPVRLFAATESRDVKFRLLHTPCLAPVQYRKACTACGREVAPEQLTYGVEAAPGEFVAVSEEELAQLPRGPEKSVEIEHFVPDGSVDAVFLAKAYYLEPEVAGRKAYALLHRVMRTQGRAAVARITLRKRERWALVRAGTEGALVLETLLDADEVRSPTELTLPEDGAVRPAEEALATQLVEALATNFTPEDNPDRYREALDALIAEKLSNPRREPSPAAASAKVVDLMEALRASLEERKAASTTKPEEEGDRGDAQRPTASAHAGARGGSAV